MATEKRLIDAKIAMSFLKEAKVKETGMFSRGINKGLNVALSALGNREIIPTVDAVEVVHGRWIKDGDVVVCSNCGEEHAWDEYRATYCEDCGAKMDGGVDNG